MSNNDIDLYDGGEIQPYSPLAPAPDWGSNTDVDLLHESYTGGGQKILGQPLPPGVSIQQVTQAYQQLGNVFVSDFLSLGHNVSQTQKAVAWFMDALKNPPAKQRPRHSYNLFEHANDPIFQAFANYAHDNGFSAKFVQDACWWVSEAGRKLAQRAQTQDGSTPPRMAPSSDPTDQLTDAQFEQVVKANDAAKAATYAYLESIWQDSTQANLRMVDNYYKSLPLAEQRALDVYTTGWIKMLNTRECVLGLHRQALLAEGGPLPSGGALAAEVAEHERAMRVDRRAWLKNETRQSRYRELIRIRDGG